MSLQSSHEVARLHFPQFCGTVLRSRCDFRELGVEGHRGDRIFVSLHLEFRFGLGHVHFLKFYFIHRLPVATLGQLLFQALHLNLQYVYFLLQTQNRFPFDFQLLPLRVHVLDGQLHLISQSLSSLWEVIIYKILEQILMQLTFLTLR